MKCPDLCFRAICGQYQHRPPKIKNGKQSSCLSLSTILLLLIIGGVELNPGPDSQTKNNQNSSKSNSNPGTHSDPTIVSTISSLQGSIKGFNETLSEINKTLSALNSTVTTIQGELKSINRNVSSLSKK